MRLRLLFCRNVVRSVLLVRWVKLIILLRVLLLVLIRVTIVRRVDGLIRCRVVGRYGRATVITVLRLICLRRLVYDVVV